MKEINIFWNRSDHRLFDNPALFYCVKDAQKNKNQVLCLFILDNHFVSQPLYTRRLRYMYTIIEQLEESMNLNIVCGNVEEIFKELSSKYKLNIFANADLDPYGRKRDLNIQELMIKLGNTVNYFQDKCSIDLKQKSGTGNLYSVFTPFKNAVMNDFLSSSCLPVTDLSKVILIREFPKIDFKALNSNLKPLSIEINNATINLADLDEQLNFEWYNNENEVLNKLDQYLKIEYFTYQTDRDDLSKINSQLSVALKWGLISPRTIKEKIKAIDPNPRESIFISELIWREFYKYLLYNYPNLLNEEFQLKYRNKKELWVDQAEQYNRFKKWIHGQTGYEIVDAAMRQLITEGYMHNRSRMIVGSVLTKTLGVDWRLGQQYFRAMLLDLDEASNNGGWQWSASVGADPKPIRIFNPYLQAAKYDPNNLYVSKYKLNSDLNNDPIIIQSIARQEALERYKKAKE